MTAREKLHARVERLSEQEVQELLDFLAARTAAPAEHSEERRAENLAFAKRFMAEHAGTFERLAQ